MRMQIRAIGHSPQYRHGRFSVLGRRSEISRNQSSEPTQNLLLSPTDSAERVLRSLPTPQRMGVMEYGSIELNCVTQQVRRFSKDDGAPGPYCPLSDRESLLLRILIRNPEVLLPRTWLYTQVWDPVRQPKFDAVDAVTVNVNYLRNKLLESVYDMVIHPVRKWGYVLSDAPPPPELFSYDVGINPDEQRHLKGLPDLYIKKGHLKLYLLTHLLYFKLKRIDLNRRQAQVLGLLMQNVGKVLSRSWITEQIWPDPTKRPNSNVVDVFVCEVRKKLRVTPYLIRTIDKEGYSLEA